MDYEIKELISQINTALDLESECLKVGVELWEIREGSDVELAHLFLCSYDGHIDTGAFMTRLAEILTDEKNQSKYPYFDLFICTKGQKKLNLHKHMTYDKSQILYYLFDLCGCKGYDVYPRQQAQRLQH